MTSPIDDTGSPHGGPVLRFPSAVELDRPVNDRTRYGTGRNLNHDPQSRRFVYRAPRRERRPVRHRTVIRQLDQNGWGACTAFALLRILGSKVYHDALTAAGKLAILQAKYPFSNEGGFDLYGDLTARDPFPGTFTYPPPGGEDTGSDGNTGAKVVRDLGVIPGWQSTFSLNAALDALQDFPLYVGSVWLREMFYPDAQGRIVAAGQMDGGHQWVADEFIPAGLPPQDYGSPLSATTDYIGIGNSWGGWGVEGRAFLSVPHFGNLLAADGDVIVLTPPTAPAPQPEPALEAASPADRKLWAVVEPYATKTGWFGTSRRQALREWRKAKTW